MKSFNRMIAAAALASSALLSVVGCGAAGGALGGLGAVAPKEDTGKSLIEEAKGYVAELKGEYVLTMGIVDEATAKVEELAVIPPGVNLKALKLKDLTAALQECIDTPIAKATELTEAAIDLKDAGSHFNQKAGLRDLKHVQAAADAGYKNVTSCAPAGLAKAKALPKNVDEVTRGFIDLKVQQVDELRKLVKDQIPNRGAALIKTAGGIVPKLAAVAAKFQAQLANPMSDQGLLKGHMSEFENLQKEVLGLVDQVKTDTMGAGKAAAEMPVKAAKAFASFK